MRWGPKELSTGEKSHYAQNPSMSAMVCFRQLTARRIISKHEFEATLKAYRGCGADRCWAYSGLECSPTSFQGGVDS